VLVLLAPLLVQVRAAQLGVLAAEVEGAQVAEAAVEQLEGAVGAQVLQMMREVGAEAEGGQGEVEQGHLRSWVGAAEGHAGVPQQQVAVVVEAQEEAGQEAEVQVHPRQHVHWQGLHLLLPWLLLPMTHPGHPPAELRAALQS
jgi:hypothetical protein